MAISLNNNVVNIQGTPGFITDLFANQPSASSVAVGTIFVASDTGTIYQSNGVTWSVIGGGGGSQDLQSVCNVSNILLNTGILSNGNTGEYTNIYANSISMYDGVTNTNIIEPYQIKIDDNNGYWTQINNIQYSITNNIGGVTTNYQNGIINYSDGIDTTNIQFGAVIQTYLNDYWGLRIQQPYLVKLGDYNNIIKGDYLVIDNDQQQIITYMSNIEFGVYIDRTKKIQLGDYLSNVNGTNINIDDFNNAITSYSALILNLNCNNVNFFIDGTTREAKMGDKDFLVNGTTFGVDDNNEYLTGSANLLSNTSSGNSGQHIKINIGGTDYKIRLELP